VVEMNWETKVPAPGPVADGEAEHGRRAVELAVEAAEVGAGEDSAPGLADEGCADEARGVVRRDAEEDADDVVLGERRRLWDELILPDLVEDCKASTREARRKENPGVTGLPQLDLTGRV
jgi:hypothetical protein